MLRHHFTTLALGIVLALHGAPEALAQDADDDAAPKAAATDLGQVVVTGSRIKRSDVEGAEPVVVISAQQIQQEGFLTVYDVLNTLNQQGSVEADTRYGSHTPNASPVSLRDLGPGAPCCWSTAIASPTTRSRTRARATSPTTATSRPRRWSGSRS